jgi:hypothetical protein
MSQDQIERIMTKLDCFEIKLDAHIIKSTAFMD